MTSGYIHEPSTFGEILLKTSGGDVNLELWSKEAPTACKNFVQHCLDGYFDDTIFHRILKGKFIQGGDPTGTGNGGEAAFGEPFGNELHGRLKFTYRGMVAMANSDPQKKNGSQFFITLDNCSWLNKKHTIFAKVVDNTIFNVLEMAKTDVNDDNRPVNPPKILSTEVLLNPFTDVKPRRVPKAEGKNSKKQKGFLESGRKPIERRIVKAPNSMKNRNSNLLSFGASEGSDEDWQPAKAKKPGSLHEAFRGGKGETEESFEALVGKKIEEGKEKEEEKIEVCVEKEVEGESKSIKEAKSEYKKLKNQMIRDKKKTQMGKRGLIAGNKKEKKKKPLTKLEKRLEKYRRRGRMSKGKREIETLKKLSQFNKSMVRQIESFESRKTTESVVEHSEEVSEDDQFWFRDGKLSFSKIPKKFKEFAIDDYVVLDDKK